MTEPGRSAAPGRAPIALQLVGLLLASLVAAQAVTLAIVLFAPPPKPAVYRLTEVAEALRGGSLNPRLGRPLIREKSRAAPIKPSERHPRDVRVGRVLADLMQVPESRVVLIQRRNPFWLQAMLGAPPREGPGGRPPPGAPPLISFRLREAAPGDAPPPEFMRPEPALFGDFTAALETAPGRWTVVRATPEPFPNDWQRRMSLWLAASLALVAPAGYLFARRITAPLRRFAEAAERLGRDPRAPAMTLSGPAEVGAAARAFNEMQERIRRYVEDRTAMVGAISHDLRTPLARIRFKMEQASPQLRAAVNADVTQMEAMISGVLAFIRDASEPAGRERLELLSVVECAVDDAALVGGDVVLVEEAPAQVLGDAVALQRMFANLIDNALKYGAAAKVSVRRAGEVVQVEIADRGPGLPPSELEQVFKPFYRLDRARNLDNGGVGLGLAVARSTARAHGGDVELKSRADGLSAVVTLPTAPASVAEPG